MQTLEQVKLNFSTHAHSYDQNARAQARAAYLLAQTLEGLAKDLPPGPVLEIGCGTGILTEKIAPLLNNRQLTLTDLSSEMLTLCLNRMQKHSQIGALAFEAANGEIISEPDRFALIISSFTAQWFLDLSSAITNLYKSLVPGGVLLFSVPTSNSFPEWRQNCVAADVPFTANSLPSTDRIAKIAQSLNAEYRLQQTREKLAYSSALHFFQEMKALGATTRIGMNSEPNKKLLRLIRFWDAQSPGDVEVSYHILQVRIRKPTLQPGLNGDLVLDRQPVLNREPGE